MFGELLFQGDQRAEIKSEPDLGEGINLVSFLVDFEVILMGGEVSDGTRAGVVQEMLEEGWGTGNLEGRYWVWRDSRG